MVSMIAAGATGALGNIKMDGYFSDNLSSMVSGVTAGSTGALGNIKMTGFTSDNLSSMVSNVTSGATGALGDIKMDDATGGGTFDTADFLGMIKQINKGATDSIMNIEMVDADGAQFDAGAMAGTMISQINAGTTGALGNLSGLSTDNITAFSEGIISASSLSLGSDNVSGTYYTIWGGLTPSDGCINSSAAVSTYSSGGSPSIPSSTDGTSSIKIEMSLTSSTSATQTVYFYSDNSCATLMGYHQYRINNIIVGRRVSGLTTSDVNGTSRPGSAYQVSFVKYEIATKALTPAAKTFLDNKFSITHTINERHITQSYDRKETLWATRTISSNSVFYIGCQRCSTYPTDWQYYDDISFQP
jgi:hypothetical protein